jgi:phospho-N-acetylmuramoyl-pentapeptide-transferase
LPIVGIPFTAGCIGFLDDFLKHRKNSSEGFSSLGKLALQVLLTAPWVYFLVSSGNNMLLHEVKFWGPVVAFLFLFLIVGSMNAVNITDGLDGLAAGSCAISFLAMLVLLHFSKSQLMICIVGLAIAVSFLWHNAHPAKVFMGDTGSHFLGGLLASMSICTGNALMLIPFSFLMGVEILSVILQLLSIHLRGKKIFKMSPLHHHFELIGWKETQVVVRFWLIHVVGMVTFIVTFNMLGLIE